MIKDIHLKKDLFLALTTGTLPSLGWTTAVSIPISAEISPAPDEDWLLSLTSPPRLSHPIK